jgi:hypothetical protein
MEDYLHVLYYMDVCENINRNQEGVTHDIVVVNHWYVYVVLQHILNASVSNKINFCTVNIGEEHLNKQLRN